MVEFETRKCNTSELKVGQAFLTKGANLDSGWDEKLMAVCTSIQPKGIGWKPYRPFYGTRGKMNVVTESYERKSNHHFEVEFVGNKEIVDDVLWRKLVILNPLYYDKNNNLHVKQVTLASGTVIKFNN